MSDWSAAISSAHRLLDEAADGLTSDDWDALGILAEIEVPSGPPPSSHLDELAALLTRISDLRSAVATQLETVSDALQSTDRLEAANRAYLGN